MRDVRDGLWSATILEHILVHVEFYKYNLIRALDTYKGQGPS